MLIIINKFMNLNYLQVQSEPLCGPLVDGICVGTPPDYTLEYSIIISLAIIIPVISYVIYKKLFKRKK